jgi:hypothetical protein
MKSFLRIRQGERVAFRLSREEWEALPYFDEAAAPRHLQVFRDRERIGLVYRRLGGPDAGSWWMARVAIDDGREPPPPSRRARALAFVTARLVPRLRRR